MFKFISTLATLLLLVTSVFGQQGAVSGTVYDEDGFPMLGANVVIQGTTVGAQTDFIEGKYQFKADPGTYTLVASYVGYGDKTLEGVVVKANETTILDISFTADTGVELELDVTVTAKAINNGEVAVMKLRQNSDKVQDVISAQEMSRLGAGNAAAALSKVTGTTVVDGKYVYVRGLGDRYSATTLNGLRLPSSDPYRNSAQLDIIPTSLLDNIVASKTFTPDLPGDFTGGSVNIDLKALPERFKWGVSASGSYNTISSLRNDFRTFDAGRRAWLGYNDGTLDLPASVAEASASDLEVFELNSSARRARNDNELAGLLDNAAKDLAPGFGQGVKSTPLNYGLSANIGNQVKIGSMPVGMFATVSYDRDFSYQEGTRANYFNPGDSEVLFRSFDLQDSRSVESAKVGGMAGLSLRPSPSNEINLYGIYSHQSFLEGRALIGANDDFGVAGTDESFFYSQVNGFKEQELIDYVAEGTHTLTGLGNTKIEWAANYVTTQQNEPDLRLFAYTEEAGVAQINPAQLPEPSRFFRDLTDQSLQGKVDVTVPFLQQKSRGNNIKFGGLYNTKERDFNEAIFQFARRDGQSFTDVGGDIEAYLAPANVGVIGGENGRNIVGLYINETTNKSNSYVGGSDVAAAYGMVTYEFSERFKAIAGLRVESTNIDVESDKAAISESPEGETGSIDTLSFLPALNLVLKTGEKSNLRGSYTQTIARPNMREIAPFGSFGFLGEVPVFGNPDLELTNISNFDLRYEIFPKAGEVIAVSAFYKRFTNPIVTTFRNAGQQQFTWTNSEEANLYGVELEFRKNLGFLTEKLANFSFSSNFSYIQSSQSIDEDELRQGLELDPSFEGTRAFNGQSPIIVNANLSWDAPDSGWDAVVAFNYFGDRLQSIGAVGTSDIFERGRGGLDLSVSKQLNNFKFTLRGRNLLNPAYETYSDFKGQEYIFSRYERGRTISLGVSYSL